MAPVGQDLACLEPRGQAGAGMGGPGLSLVLLCPYWPWALGGMWVFACVPMFMHVCMRKYDFVSWFPRLTLREARVGR